MVEWREGEERCILEGCILVSNDLRVLRVLSRVYGVPKATVNTIGVLHNHSISYLLIGVFLVNGPPRWGLRLEPFGPWTENRILRQRNLEPYSVNVTMYSNAHASATAFNTTTLITITYNMHAWNLLAPLCSADQSCCSVHISHLRPGPVKCRTSIPNFSFTQGMCCPTHKRQSTLHYAGLCCQFAFGFLNTFFKHPQRFPVNETSRHTVQRCNTV